MIDLLFELAKFAAVLTALFAGWLAVQRAYRRAFPDEPGDMDDLLAERMHGCTACHKLESCEFADYKPLHSH